MARLHESFFSEGSTVDIARRLIGMKLVSNAGGRRTAGLIVETEAYLRDDPACHASRGRTKRNDSMFLSPGHSYVYLIYGMYHCFNVVTAPSGIGEAVLVRAIEPIEGIEEMFQRRGRQKANKLADGPGKLCRAMGIDRSLDGKCLWDSELLHIEECGSVIGGIESSSRVGISCGKDMMLRFFIKGNPFVSKL